MTPETLRKIDILIAEKVMGWPTIDFSRLATKEGYVRMSCAYYGSDHPTNRCGIFQPSVSIAASWEVVEKMKADKWRVSIEDFDNRYRVNFSRGSRYMSENNREHLSVPLCIALAALRAVGVDTTELEGGR